MRTDLEIKFKDRTKALRFKRHIEKTHPSTRGKIEVEPCLRKKRMKRGRGEFKFNPLAQARRVTML